VNRIFFVILFSGFLLASCGGGGDEKACNGDSFWDGTLGVCVPDGWQAVDASTLQERGVPGEVVVAFQSDTSLSGYYPTVTVTRERLSQEFTPQEYSEGSIEAVSTLPGYQLFDEQDVSIDGEKIAIHVFQSQPSEDAAQYRFYQLSTVSANVGYTFTVATPLTIEDELGEEILAILRSVTFQEL